MKSKIIFLVLSVMCLYGVAAWAIERYIILPSFMDLERKEANADMNRVASALRRELLVLDNLCHDYAAWDDTYAFIVDHNQGYLQSNIIEETYKDLKLNLILYFDAQGKYVAGNGYDLVRGELLDATSMITIRPGHPLLAHQTTTDTVSGIIATRRGPMLVSSQSIITSENRGPLRGTVIVGWLLDKARIVQLQHQLLIDLNITPIASDSIANDDRAMVRELATNSDNLAIKNESDTVLTAYKTFPGINGEPIILLKASLPRDILQTGRMTMKDSLLSTFVAGFVVIIVLMLSIHYIIANPLMRLVSHLATIKQTGDLRSITYAKRTDEVGALYQGFNALTEELIEKDRAKAAIEREKEQLITDLQSALSRVQMLSGLLPICASCKMIRDDQGQWNQIESYIKERSNADFSHGICPDCARKLYPDLFAEEMQARDGDKGTGYDQT